MIFIISEAFVNLGACDLGETIRKRVDGFTVLQKTDNVVNADAGSFNRRCAAANGRVFHDVTIQCLSRHVR